MLFGDVISQAVIRIPPPRMFGFEPKPVHVGFAVDKVGLW
jgi:hypothetical protein